jgi:Raf kinase inhibitor-like YbhB/YbcL family protein
MKIGLIAAVACMMMSGTAQAADFKLESADFRDGVVQPAQFANAFGCSGANRSPAITWSGAPEGTRSFVVTMYDKDAPTGSGFWHWVVVDIPADVTSLDAGAGDGAESLPKGAHMTSTDAGQAMFLGACPPAGESHEYRITIKALKVDKLPVPPNASAALVGFVSNMNKLAEASIVAKGAR